MEVDGAGWSWMHGLVIPIYFLAYFISIEFLVMTTNVYLL